MLSHETPGPTSLWPFPEEVGMRPELVCCACLQANASASYCQLNIETARPSSFSFFVSFSFFFFILIGRDRTMSRYFTLNSVTLPLHFPISEALQNGPQPPDSWLGARGSCLQLPSVKSQRGSEGRAPTCWAFCTEHCICFNHEKAELCPPAPAAAP